MSVCAAPLFLVCFALDMGGTQTKTKAERLREAREKFNREFTSKHHASLKALQAPDPKPEPTGFQADKRGPRGVKMTPPPKPPEPDLTWEELLGVADDAKRLGHSFNSIRRRRLRAKRSGLT